MATIEDIDAEIAKRQRIASIDALIAEKQGGAPDAILEPAQAIGGNLAGFVGSGLAGIAELIRTGDFDSAANAVTAVQQGVSERFAPQTEAGQQGLSNVVGAIQAVDENIIKPAVAGTAGLAQLALNPTDLEGAKQTVRSVRDVGLGKSAGQQAFDATGSPAIATLFEVAPVIGEELIGAGIGKLSRVKSAAKSNAAKSTVSSVENAIKNPVDPSLETVSQVIQKGTPEQIADVVRADPNFYRAADELGINVEPLASFASQNPQFRDVSGALQKVPGSVLDVQARNFINATSQKADDLITQYGGTLDKAQLGLDFKRDALKNIDDLFEQADTAYSDLKKVIPPSSRVEAPSTLEFINAKAVDVGGFDNLPPKLKSMLAQLTPKTKTTKGRIIVDPATGARRSTGTVEVIPPTLGKVDQLRREVGQAINRGSGQFKDVESGLNKAIYAKLTKDQDAIATKFGGDSLALSDTAKGLVRQRKQLEDNLQVLLGKDLNQSLNVNVSGAVKNLSKGEVDRFKSIVNAIPKAKRSEVVLSAMNDVFKGTGVGQQQLSPTQFTKWYQTINRSPATKKALFENLPKDSQAAIDNLFQVSRGVSRALGQTTPTGRINALFNNETGFIRKMIGKTLPSVVGIATGNPAASLATNAAVDFMRQGTDAAKSASDLMSTSQFQNVIRQSVKEGVIDGSKSSKALLNAESNLMKTKKYQKWVDTLAAPDKAALQGGLIGYLFNQEEGQQ